jgi:SAM-dependent methyltransferase
MPKPFYDLLLPAEPSPGMPRDLIDTPVNADHHKALLHRADVQAYLLEDNVPVPSPNNRESYYGDRHLEYWLSGVLDTEKILQATQLPLGSMTRAFDFGGCTGRVARHLTRRLGWEVWLSDININYINWLNTFGPETILAFQNVPVPHFPLPSAYFDVGLALSVFTHIDEGELHWLLELRRIVKPGGWLYLTIHDEYTWDAVKNEEWLFNSLVRGQLNKEALWHDFSQPLTEDRVVINYSSDGPYNCNVFFSQDYIRRKWSPFFQTLEFRPFDHNHQTVVIMKI